MTKLHGLLLQARPVIEQPNFADLLRSTIYAELAEDGWKLLERFLTHPVVIAYDREIAELCRESKQFPVPFVDWLDGLGAIETRAGLKAVVDASSDKSRLDSQHVRTLRSGLKKLMDEVKQAASSTR